MQLVAKNGNRLFDHRQRRRLRQDHTGRVRRGGGRVHHRGNHRLAVLRGTFGFFQRSGNQPRIALQRIGAKFTGNFRTARRPAVDGYVFAGHQIAAICVRRHFQARRQCQRAIEPRFRLPHIEYLGVGYAWSGGRIFSRNRGDQQFARGGKILCRRLPIQSQRRGPCRLQIQGDCLCRPWPRATLVLRPFFQRDRQYLRIESLAGFRDQPVRLRKKRRIDGPGHPLRVVIGKSVETNLAVALSVQRRNIIHRQGVGVRFVCSAIYIHYLSRAPGRERQAIQVRGHLRVRFGIGREMHRFRRQSASRDVMAVATD